MGSDRYMEEHQFIGTGGIGHLGGGSGGAPAVPKKKTLEYENLTFTYEFETRIFKIEGPDGAMTFGPDELSELRAAMTTFGIGLTSTSGMVTYR